MVPLPGKGSAAYHEHLTDFCRFRGQPTPVEADPSGNECFSLQKRVVKGAEFLNLEHPDCGDPTERGFADVWRKDCFGGRKGSPPLVVRSTHRSSAAEDGNAESRTQMSGRP
jgi:hypothetical protein